MPRHKTPQAKGKFSFARFFQKFKEGESVAVVRELSNKFGYPKTLQGRTGKVILQKGAAYKVEIKDFNKPKTYFIKPIHLVKIQEK